MNQDDQSARDSAAMGADGLPDMNIQAHTKEATDPLIQPVQEQIQKIVVGDRTFATTEEAIAYANGLASARSAPATQAPAPTSPTAPKVKLGQLLFENPDEAVEQLISRAKEESRAEQRVVEETKKFWQDFYTAHPDLKGSEFLVDAVLVQGQNSGVYGQMTRDEAAPILAARARQEVLKIKNVPSGGTELSSQPATVASASGSPTPRTQTPKAQATNFVAELAAMRKRG